MTKANLSSLPRVDRVAQHPSLHPMRQRLGNDMLTRLARQAIERAREHVKAGGSCPSLDEVAEQVATAAQSTLKARARPVINATGVVLHTNLGRSPLGKRVVEALTRSAAHYTSIEIDLETGRRGARGAFAEGALAQLAGAESALVVNNCAAAVLLALGALALHKKVLVSRGELIEIGGGFRVPEVLGRSGAELIEVGTTNRTRVADYAAALSQGGVAAILRVHQGNFRQVGFVESPARRALAELAHHHGVLMIEDLGGGAMLDFTPYGLAGEPTARQCIAEGADVVCFSTDKVLGGPQGGALVGRIDAIERARRDPLARALRLGRLPLVALEATLACYLDGDLDEVAALRAIRMPLDAVRARAEGWQRTLASRGIVTRVVDLDAAVGGGALAETPLASAGIAIDVAAPDAMAYRLRTGDPALIARVHEDRVLVDARTVLPDEEDMLIDAIAAAMRGIENRD